MASSVTVTLPESDVLYACWAPLYSGFETVPTLDDVYHCANTSKGQRDSDFVNICCDGNIIDRTQKLFDPEQEHEGPISINLKNLVCCRDNTPLEGGIQPINTEQQTCTEGNPTPLASLAATNTANAQIYPVTFVSASGEPPNVGDFLFTQTPRCMWLYTANSNVSLTTVTVPPAEITRLPVGWPDSNSPLIFSSNPYQVASVVPYTTDSSGWVHFSSPGQSFTFQASRMGPSTMTAPATKTKTTTTTRSTASRSADAVSMTSSTSSATISTSGAQNAPRPRLSWCLLLSQFLLAAPAFLSS